MSRRCSSSGNVSADDDDYSSRAYCVQLLLLLDRKTATNVEDEDENDGGMLSQAEQLSWH